MTAQLVHGVALLTFNLSKATPWTAHTTGRNA